MQYMRQLGTFLQVFIHFGMIQAENGMFHMICSKFFTIFEISLQSSCKYAIIMSGNIFP